jgi:hypothetical protein
LEPIYSNCFVYRRGKRIGDTEISRLVRLIEQWSFGSCWYRGCVALKVEEGTHMLGISSRSPSLHPALDYLCGHKSGLLCHTKLS